MQDAPPLAQTQANDRSYARSPDPRDRLIVALDVGSAADALRLANDLAGRCRWLKVGMELFYAAGGDLVRRLQDQGFRIFLDLKLHDIPNTVAAAVRSVHHLGVDILTVHAAGGPEMLRAASHQAELLEQPPLLAGVTVLTSMNDLQLHSIGVASAPQQQVLRLAALALESSLKGLVSSPLEVGALRQHFGPAPVLIVPGIRPAGSALDDQNRTAAPHQAMRDGASMLVIGRPITRATDPPRAIDAILADMQTGLTTRLDPIPETPGS